MHNSNAKCYAYVQIATSVLLGQPSRVRKLGGLGASIAKMYLAHKCASVKIHPLKFHYLMVQYHLVLF